MIFLNIIFTFTLTPHGLNVSWKLRLFSLFALCIRKIWICTFILQERLQFEMNQLNAQAYLSELKLSLFRWINSSWRTRFCGHVSIVQCACRLWMHSSPSPPIHTGCGLILGREGMVVVVTVSGPLSCTSQMFDFIRALSICRVRSEDVAELEDIWWKKRISWKSSITISWYVRLRMLGYASSSYKHIHTTHNSSIRSDEGLILEMLSSKLFTVANLRYQFNS